jgi:predicted unusual protein kinase regulating ubiquinone biosynthesis (AarF/ABC1/UbiB family)
MEWMRAIYLAGLFFWLGFSPAGFAASSEGDQLRLFLAETLKSREIADPHAQAEALRGIFARNWHLFGKLVDPKDNQRILREAGFDKFLPFNFSDLRLPFFHEVSREMLGVGRAKAQEVVRRLPDDVFNGTAAGMALTVEHAPLSKAPALGTVVDRLKSIKMPGFHPEDIDFLSHAFLNFFDGMPEKTKNRMITAWLELPAKSTWDTQFSALVQNAGPSLQKLFQLIGRESNSKELTALSTNLLSKVRYVPFPEVKEQVETAYGKPLNQLFQWFSETPSAAGTVGQGHRAITLDGRHVFVKVLRPGIEDEMRAELAVLVKSLAGNRMTEKLAQRASESFLKEVDLVKESQAAERAQLYVDPALGLGVPTVDKAYEPKKTVLVYEEIQGKTLEDAGDVDPRIRAQALKNMMGKWFDVNIETGFFHGDLHAGNIMIDTEHPAPHGLPFRATYLDFGAVGDMSPAQRKSFFELFAATASKKTEAVMDALGKMAAIPDANRKELFALVADVMKKKGANSAAKLDEILGLALENGLDVDANIAMFSRTGFFLTRELDKVNAEILAKFPGTKVEDPELVLARAAMKQFGADLWKKLTGGKGDSVLLDAELGKEYVSAAASRVSGSVHSACEVLFGGL